MNDAQSRWCIEKCAVVLGHPATFVLISMYIKYKRSRGRHTGNYRLGKGKVLPYSLPSVGPGADPGAQAVSPQACGYLRSFHQMVPLVHGSIHPIPV